MICDAARVLALLGATVLPPKGTIIIVPVYVAERYSEREQRAARNCAGRFGIVLKKARER